MSTFKFNLPQGLLEAAASILESKYHQTHKLVDEKTGKEIKIGDKVKDFRGDTHEIKGYRPGAHAGSTGRVHTNVGEFFPGVVGAKVVARDDVKEALHPNQQKIDVVDDEKIDAKDFAKLRKMKKMKEEVEQVDESNYKSHFSVRGQYKDKDGNYVSITHKIKYVKDADHAKRIATEKVGKQYKDYKAIRATPLSEEVEQVDEAKSSPEFRAAVKTARNLASEVMDISKSLHTYHNPDHAKMVTYGSQKWAPHWDDIHKKLTDAGIKATRYSGSSHHGDGSVEGIRIHKNQSSKVVESIDEAKKGEKDLNITKAHLNAIAGAKSHDEAKGIYNKLLDDQKTLTPETIAKHRRAVETSKSHGDIVKLAYNAYLKGEGLGVVK